MEVIENTAIVVKLSVKRSTASVTTQDKPALSCANARIA